MFNRVYPLDLVCLLFFLFLFSALTVLLQAQGSFTTFPLGALGIELPDLFLPKVS